MSQDDRFDFDTVIDRKDTESLKWARYRGRDVIPMWVADMDFRAPGPVVRALQERVAHGVFGYAVPPQGLAHVVVDRMRRLYGWAIEPSWIVWLPGVVPALHAVCRAIGDDGDEVLTFTPAYPPFLSAPSLSRRQLRTVPLKRENDRYTFDMEGLERATSSRSRVLLLCSPHNPVGRRYEQEELRRVAQMCVASGITICSDEIHCDLILDDGPHVPTAVLGPEIAARTITLMAPSKTFNLPGLNCAFAVIENEELRRRFRKATAGTVPHTNALGYVACLAAYRDGEPWRAALIEYLRGNCAIVQRFVNEADGLSMEQIQATYLAWINVEDLRLADPARFFAEHGVGLSDGRDFHGDGFVRLNFACPRATLTEALNRLRRALDGLRRR